jgi:hypothetical protein
MLAEHVEPIEEALHEAPDEPARVAISAVFKTKKDPESKAEGLVCEITCKATLASARDVVQTSVSGGQLTLGF